MGSRHVLEGSLLLVLLCVSAAYAINDRYQHVVGGKMVMTDFSLDRAYNQLMYAYSAYCPEDALKAWNCYFCTLNSSTSGFKVEQVVNEKITSIYGYVGSQGSTVQVSFRGTIDLINWIADLDYSHSTPYKNVPGAFVHKGFYDSYELVKVQIRLAVLKLVTQTKATQVFFTGHSLGAALATLSALDLVSELRIPVSVYNFGSPRVGNQAFADYFHDKISTVYRIVNKADVVPHLPRYEMDYRHVSEEVWWKTADGPYKLCDMSGEDPTCSDSVLIYSTKDHLDYLNIQVADGKC